MTGDRKSMESALRMIFEGIDLLKSSCNDSRQFTIDGRLVGDIGEIIAAREFEIELDEKGREDHDAKTLDGRNVQIKATFQDSLTFKKEGELYLGLKLRRDGTHEVVFNGPGRVIAQNYLERKGLGEKLLSFPVKKLRDLSATVAESDRVPLRKL